MSGLFGGMGGCAMIGQTMINVKVSGARTRISTFLVGVFLLILLVGFGTAVGLDPSWAAATSDSRGNSAPTDAVGAGQRAGVVRPDPLVCADNVARIASMAVAA
nr:hypothetical protein [Tessaracoccus sp. ZS01]